MTRAPHDHQHLPRLGAQGVHGGGYDPHPLRRHDRVGEEVDLRGGLRSAPPPPSRPTPRTQEPGGRYDPRPPRRLAPISAQVLEREKDKTHAPPTVATDFVGNAQGRSHSFAPMGSTPARAMCSDRRGGEQPLNDSDASARHKGVAARRPPRPTGQERGSRLNRARTRPHEGARGGATSWRGCPPGPGAGRV